MEKHSVLNAFQTRAIKMTGMLQIPDSIDDKTIGDLWKAWQPELVAKIFESYNPKDMTRRIREFFVLIPKKNGKSTLSAALAIVFMLLNQRYNNEFGIIAPTKKVAGNSFQPICAMIRKNPYLKKRFKITPTTKTITDLQTDSQLTVYSADTNTVSGIKCGFVIFDELWKLTENKDIENILIEAKGGFLSKPEAFCVYLTTQSDKPPLPAFQRFLDLARSPIENQEASGFYSVLFEPENKDLKIEDIKPDLIEQVNPNLGVTVDKDYLLTEFNKYREFGGDAFLSWASKHLNLQIKPEFKQNGWAGAEFWEQAETEITLQDIAEKSEAVVMAIDGGGLDDLIGICIAGRLKGENNWLMWHSATCTNSALHKNGTFEIYQKFIKQNELNAFETIEGCFDYISSLVDFFIQKKKLVWVGFDPNGAIVIANHLKQTTDIIDSQIMGIFQGNLLSSAIKSIEHMLALGMIQVNRTDLMRWQIKNIRMSGRYFFEKTEKAAKIDSAVAMAIAGTMINANPKSMNEEEDVGLYFTHF